LARTNFIFKGHSLAAGTEFDIMGIEKIWRSAWRESPRGMKVFTAGVAVCAVFAAPFLLWSLPFLSPWIIPLAAGAATMAAGALGVATAKVSPVVEDGSLTLNGVCLTGSKRSLNRIYLVQQKIDTLCARYSQRDKLPPSIRRSVRGHISDVEGLIGTKVQVEEGRHFSFVRPVFDANGNEGMHALSSCQTRRMTDEERLVVNFSPAAALRPQEKKTATFEVASPHKNPGVQENQV
jgi:hypothetical protein